MKKLYMIFVIALALSLLIPGYLGMDIQDDNKKDKEDYTIPEINLPTMPTTMYVWEFLEGWPAAYKTLFRNIPGEYDIVSMIYNGWCVDYGTPIPGGLNNPHEITFYSSYDPPEHLAHENWTKINYIINHKPEDADAYDIQRAIWYFINFGPWEWDYTGYMEKPVSEVTDRLIEKTKEESDNWNPTQGDLIAIICDPGANHEFQITFIEFPLYEGATPGFWKNNGIRIGWPESYDTEMTLENAGFIIPNGAMTDNPKRHVYSEDTLLEALKYKGGDDLSGMAQTLLRAAVAAVLNAAHDEITYPLTETEIIDQVNTALTENRNSMENLKNELDEYNNFGYEEWW